MAEGANFKSFYFFINLNLTSNSYILDSRDYKEILFDFHHLTISSTGMSQMDAKSGSGCCPLGNHFICFLKGSHKVHNRKTASCDAQTLG